MSLYKTDYYAWTREMAETIREGRFVGKTDQLLIAEEIEDLGKSERNSLRSAVIQLFMHLLKQKFQPEKEAVSWELSIKNQRIEIDDIIDENPSLLSALRDSDFIEKAYRKARVMAAIETKLPEDTFPPECP